METRPDGGDPPAPDAADGGHCVSAQECPALAWHRQRLVELERQAASDCLTGLWNRAHFERLLEAERDRSWRYGQPVSLILFDVDHFKRINDEYGHPAGDSVLREIALLGNATIRSSDMLFRWGGEEFAVLAPSTGHRGAVRLAESLRDGVAGHRFPVVGSLTISLGVAEHADCESAESWLRRADQMLYAAKRGGRNAVRVDARGNSDLWAARPGRSALQLVWQEAYECGQPAIDGEHRELFRMANELIEACLVGGEKSEAAARTCDRLLAHIALHFAHEETLLAGRGYAGLEAHRRAHAGLLRRARELRADLASGGTGLGGMVEFLAGDVVARHLFKTDREFFPLFAGADRPPGLAG